MHRIQGITIKEGILRQPFGYCAVQVEVIQSEGKEEKVTLHPIIRKDRVQQLLAHLQLPYELNASITSLPKAHCAAISLIVLSFRYARNPAYWNKHIL